VAQAEVGNLHLRFHTAKDNAFFSPVKLERITGSEKQGNERISRSGGGLFEVADKTLNGRIGPGIPFRNK